LCHHIDIANSKEPACNSFGVLIEFPRKVAAPLADSVRCLQPRQHRSLNSAIIKTQIVTRNDQTLQKTAIF
jgi:hypothetical protein